MFNIGPSEETEILSQLRGEGKLVEQIKLEGEDWKRLDSGWNPHGVEAIRRYLSRFLQSGDVEIVTETKTNLTGTKTIQASSGRYRLSGKGGQKLLERNKALLDGKDPGPWFPEVPQRSKYPPLR